MPYDAKPNTDDLILNTWEEGDRINVSLYLREGDDGQGAAVMECWDEDCRALFEDGFLKRGGLGRLSDRDSTLLESAFAYASELKLGALFGFETRLGALVGQAETKLAETYEALDADTQTYPEDDEARADDIAEAAVEKVMEAMNDAFGWLSERRVEDVREHLDAAAAELAAAKTQAPPAP